MLKLLKEYLQRGIAAHNVGIQCGEIVLNQHLENELRGDLKGEDPIVVTDIHDGVWHLGNGQNIGYIRIVEKALTDNAENSNKFYVHIGTLLTVVHCNLTVEEINAIAERMI